MVIVSANPSRNYEIVGEVEASTEQEVRDAVAKARAAQPRWAALTQRERNRAIESFVAVCKDQAEEIALAISKEMGKPILQARDEVGGAFDYFCAYMDMAEAALAPGIVFEDADVAKVVDTVKLVGEEK